ncbi:Spore maturation protein CgeB [Cnuella takakiae]|uniref:Spore maturation protein CgeB n=1 Tax=Cnuella takakiae TaxID=1302690 RepID=A0A1M5A441_9BACT|nr:glycosyltransferase [Cnuella takakiae]OLY92105.1 glycosyltransferase [Cnuella takakiae]SHF24975.1 Spore maturation protein CgeB [Cnuella takakiae]
MKIILFYHSLLSDWNHGNAHFLRGVVTELLERGNEVVVYEPQNNWSLSNLLKDHGEQGLADFSAYYPLLKTSFYDPATINLEAVLAGADLVIVHEWNEHALVKAIGELRTKKDFRLLFHDTHHRAVTERSSMAQYDLSHYDGVLAFGNVIRDIYLQEGWAQKAWTWHEAADTRIFHPLVEKAYEGDLVWVGNWGDDERTKELFEFLINPVKELGLKATIYGVRYPDHALKALADAGITYGGWLPNYKAPEVFAKYRFTVHVPRRPYVEALPGIPTIRPFEALACGIPLISAPWEDAEGLFTPGEDFLVANNGEEMKTQMQQLLTDHDLVRRQTVHGLQTIQDRHTCAHRVDQLYAICQELQVGNLAAEQTTILTMDERP